MSAPRDRFWGLLNLVQDYFQDGWRQSHPGPPVATSAPSGPRLPAPDRGAPVPAQGPAADSLERIATAVKACRECGLCDGRTQAVPGEGAAHPLVLVVGEGPGAEEDRTGRPFVGAAGQYLDKWLAAINLDRGTNCFIANVVKCRPPGNRDPAPDEQAACLPYLQRQIAVLRPRAILTVGRIASQALLQNAGTMGSMRGRVYAFAGLPLVATYHPSGVLRNQGLRPAVWDDLKLLQAQISTPT